MPNGTMRSAILDAIDANLRELEENVDSAPARARQYTKQGFYEKLGTPPPVREIAAETEETDMSARVTDVLERVSRVARRMAGEE